MSWVQRCLTHRNVFALKFLILFPNLKLSFIVIVVVRIFLTHSKWWSLTKNMIRRAPMGTICRPLDPGRGSTEANVFIQCINGREPQIHKWWCLGFDRICRKVHPTECVEVPSGTVREFVNYYLVENGSQTLIILQLSINNSVQFLGFLTNPGEVHCHLLPTSWLTLMP